MVVPDAVKKALDESPVVAVLTMDRPDDAPPLAAALREGGIRAIELTLRTPRALDALRALAAAEPSLLCGAGTVLTPEQARQVRAAGAAFAVSPGLNPNTVRATIDAGLPFLHGVCTPSDIERALELGCAWMKYFPAETSGGLAHLRAMAAPYVHLGVRFIPLGGVNESNVADYLREPLVAAVGGSWLASKADLAARRWGAVRDAARRAVGLAASVRTPAGA